MLLGVLDNRDSFTYNLVHLLEPYFAEVRVRRCDDPLALADLHDVDALVLSPGPGLPRESGALLDVIADHFGRTPILGVCLVHTGTPRHGIARPITWTEAWAGGVALPNPTMVGLYHSWAVDSERLSPDWSVTATDFEGLPAAMRHRTAPVWAVQFHPESVLTPQGPELLKAWVEFSASVVR
jgi:anthranilate synthase component II